MANWKNPVIQNFMNYMGLDPLVALRKEANYLLNKIGFRESAENLSPIDIDEVSKYLKLKDKTFKYNESQSTPAQIVENPDQSLSIELNLDKSTYAYFRHRFIIAHEIGHWVIRSKSLNRLSSKEIEVVKKHKYEEELLCHYFASELLMPFEVFMDNTRGKNLDSNLIDLLAHRFQVSDYNILNRIIVLYPNITGVYWKNKSSPTSNLDQLRVTSIFPNERIRKSSFIPIHATAKNERFSPNILLQSYKKNREMNGLIEINDFGEVEGEYHVYVYNASMKPSLFEANTYNRKFDLISLMKLKDLNSSENLFILN